MKAMRAAILPAVAVALALAVAAAAVAAGQSVLLQFNFQQGKVLRYKGSLTGTGHMTLQSQSQPLVVKGQFVLVQTVGPQKSGGFELTTTLEKAKLSFQVGNEPEKSTVVSPPALVQVVTKDGRVLSERGWSEAKAGPDGEPLHGTLKWLAAQMPRAGFPEGQVAAGDTWTQDLPIPNSTQPAKQTSTLKGFEKWKGLDCAKVVTTVALPLDQSLPPDPIGTKVYIKGRQQLETTLLFAYERGMVASQQTTVAIHVESVGQMRDVKEPVRATMDATAKVVMELERTG